MFDPVAYINTPRWQSVNLGLERIGELLEGLGNPQDSLRFVHVAGTNGKGSTCSFIASILRQAGYTVGLFTSPALYRFEDRIRVNGENISSQDLQEVTLQVKSVADSMENHPTEFELLTAVAFCYFVRQGCAIAVVEVGLGGRLDSTNVIKHPEVSVITPISFDHCALLGSTLAEIAAEKAGIIKPGVPVVVAPQHSEAFEVIQKAAVRAHAPIHAVNASFLSGQPECFSYRKRKNLSLGLAGSFQLENAASALEAVEILTEAGWNISEAAIEAGLKQTSWAGRFDVVCENPLIIFDGGHNISGMQALSRALAQDYPNYHRLVLTGVLADKDYPHMAQLLVQTAHEIVTVTPQNPRSLDAQEYAQTLQEASVGQAAACTVSSASTIKAGVAQVIQRYETLAAKGENPPLICVCGSLYLLGSVMEVLHTTGVVLS